MHQKALQKKRRQTRIAYNNATRAAQPSVDDRKISILVWCVGGGGEEVFSRE